MTFLSEKAMEAARRDLPLHCSEHLIAYFNERRPVGDFLTALLSNDLMATYQFADAINIHCIRDYVTWLYNYPPGRPIGWGSKEAVRKWLADE